MNLLALDTSSVACTVALQIVEEVTERHEEHPREHTRLLVPMIRSLLDGAGVGMQDIDAIVLGNGPGSFIGMRIGASVAQGMAFASGLKIIPVSSLAAVAAAVLLEHDADEVFVAQDAHLHEVYLGLYRRNSAGLPEEIGPERLHGCATIAELQLKPGGPRIAAGYGWQRYPDLLAQNCDHFDAVVDIWYPRARHLLLLATAADRSAISVAPHEVVPAYLRHKVAEKPVSLMKKV